MKKLIIISLILSMSLNLHTFAPVVTTAGENIAELTEEKIAEFMALPNRDEIIATALAGNILSYTSALAGNKCLPPMGTIRIGRVSIPVKALANFIASYVVYGSTIYVCNKTEIIKAITHNNDTIQP
jgi:hypothetical protein